MRSDASSVPPVVFAGAEPRDVELLEYGHNGPPMTAFPSSTGTFFEYEDHGMLGALAQELEHGDLRLICVTSVDTESWYNRRAQPRASVTRHLRYGSYILNGAGVSWTR